jgi:hypothetical protein
MLIQNVPNRKENGGLLIYGENVYALAHISVLSSEWGSVHGSSNTYNKPRVASLDSNWPIKHGTEGIERQAQINTILSNA